ncbi:MAG TPA: hypothetical protein VFQ44_05290 [Streptosporangiaceae bacterium]|nr:hypothetical protein [Streptosporangiaceae bacterium]
MTQQLTAPPAADIVRTALAALDRAKPPPAAPTRQPGEWHTSFTAALASIGL